MNATATLIRDRLILGCTQFQACERKRPFETKADAQAHKGMDVYYCGYCGKWHRASRKKVRRR